MWVTTKSIVKEIKRNQEELMTKIETMTFAQNESTEEFQNQIKVLMGRIEGIEAELLEIKTEQSNQSKELLAQLTDVRKLLTTISENLVSSYDNCIISVNDEIDRTSRNNAQAIIDKVSDSAKKIILSAEQRIQQSKERVLCDIGKIMKSEQNISSRVELLYSQNERVEKRLNVASESIKFSIVEMNDKTLEEIEKITKELETFLATEEKRGTVVNDNIETMNVAMQEIMRDLLSLDEGNRLIIARLLLRDLEG